RNGLYMEALTQKQSIALCLVDLAHGYQHRYGMEDGTFVLQCVEKALQYYPNYSNALLLKSEVIKGVLNQLALQKKYAETKEELAKLEGQYQQAFSHYEQLIGKIHDLGYRDMPDEMYLDWLASIREHRDEYENPKIKNTFKNR